MLSKIVSIIREQKSLFYKNRVLYVFDILSTFFLLLSISTLLIFTYRDGFNIITNLLCSLFCICSFIYCLISGRLFFNYYSITSFLFLIYALFISLIGGQISDSYIKTLMTIFALTFMIFQYSVVSGKKNLIPLFLILSVFILCTFIVTDNFSNIISLDFDRMGTKFGNVNALGSAIACGYFFILYYMFTRKRMWFSLAPIAILFVFCAICTGSKEAILGILFSTIFTSFILFGKKHILIYLTLVVCIFVCFFLVLNIPFFASYKERLFNSILTLFSLDPSYIDNSTLSRFSMFADGINMWLKNFLFGYGSGAFAKMSSFSMYSHNSISETLVNFGAIGFFLYFSPFVFTIYNEIKFKKNNIFILFFLSILFLTIIGGVIYINKYINIILSSIFAMNFIDNKENQRCIKFDIDLTKFYVKVENGFSKHIKGKNQTNENSTPLYIISGKGSCNDQRFLMDILRDLDSSKHLDFCFSSKGLYDDEIIEKGSNIFYMPLRQKHPFKYKKELKDIVSKNGYRTIILSPTSPFILFDLLTTKKAGVSNIIICSNNSNISSNIKKIGHCILRPFLRNNVTIRMASSIEAANFMFGKKYIEKKGFIPFNKGIFFDDYCFNENYRKELRQEFNVDDKTLVVGTISGFEKRKNLFFLLKVFKEVLKSNKNSILLFVGPKNALFSIMEKEAKKLGVADCIFFAGPRKDINRFYSMFDFFLLPSFCEGTANLLIEAQASNLNCICSSRISREVNITNKIRYLSTRNPKEWAGYINYESICNRHENNEFIYRKNGYLISESSRVLESCVYSNEKKEQLDKSQKNFVGDDFC